MAIMQIQKKAFDLIPGNADIFQGVLYKAFYKMYFSNFNNGTWKFYVSDGTLANTVAIGSYLYPASKTIEYASDVYYLASEQTFTGYEVNLYKTNGTAAGTALVKTIAYNFPSPPSIQFSEIVIFNNKLYLTIEDANGDKKIFSYDAITDILKAIDPITDPLTEVYGLNVLGNKLYFSAKQSVLNSGIELYSVDANDNVAIVSNIETKPGLGSEPFGFYTYANKLYFMASESLHGLQLYAADNAQVSNVGIFTSSVTKGTYVSNYIGNNGSLFFTAYTDSSINFYKFNPTGNVLTNLKTVFKKTGAACTFSGYSGDPFIYNGLMYFFFVDKCVNIGGTSYAVTNLFQSDGTANGTKPIYVSGFNLLPETFKYTQYNIIHNGSVFFNANMDGLGDEPTKFTSAPLSIDNENSNLNFAFYPNPFTNTINVENSSANNLQATISTLTGTTLKVQNLQSGTKKIIFLEVPAGLYLLQLQDEQSKKISTYKIIKE